MSAPEGEGVSRSEVGWGVETRTREWMHQRYGVLARRSNKVEEGVPKVERGEREKGGSALGDRKKKNEKNGPTRPDPA